MGSFYREIDLTKRKTKCFCIWEYLGETLDEQTLMDELREKWKKLNLFTSI